jgi:hypothetical protein
MPEPIPESKLICGPFVIEIMDPNLLDKIRIELASPNPEKGDALKLIKKCTLIQRNWEVKSSDSLA